MTTLYIIDGHDKRQALEFEENSLLVRWRSQSLRETWGPYERGQTWAEPDLDHAALQMRRLMQDPGLGARIGNRARQDARALYSPAAAGARMKARLRAGGEPRLSGGGSALPDPG
jgi:hypothetical protein